MKLTTDALGRVDIQALMRALPVSTLEPNTVAYLGGFSKSLKNDATVRESIRLLEPPASERVPYIDPVAALATLLRYHGLSTEEAKREALHALDRMKHEVAAEIWVNFFDDFIPESPDCLPVAVFVSWLRNAQSLPNALVQSPPLNAHKLNLPVAVETPIAPDIVDFLEKAAEVVPQVTRFRGPDNWKAPWSWQDLPALPPPKAMMEFVPGPPWSNWEWGDWEAGDNPFLQWREAMRPVAQVLETALGEPVYYFKRLGDDIDDDAIHRFLVLHWCCTRKPDSAFVRYLLRVSGARDVEALKAALVDPANYTQPFKMYDAFTCIESIGCSIDYVPPETHRTVGIVFLTEQAREVAQWLLAQQIGTHAYIVAPMDLATEAWVKQATRHCRSWTVSYVYDGKREVLIDTLAAVDTLCVIANEPCPQFGFELKLSDQAENLLWLALSLGVEARYFHVDYERMANPEPLLRKRGVPERVAAQQAQRAAFTRQLTEIRLDNDFGSSGLWDERGRCLGYDLLDLPFPLVKRIAAWQRDYDETMNPPDMGDEAWWERHEQEAVEIAKALQAALGPKTVVKLYRPQGWVPVDQIDRCTGR